MVEDLLEVQMPDGSMLYMTEQDFMSQNLSVQHRAEQERMSQDPSVQYMTEQEFMSNNPGVQHSTEQENVSQSHSSQYLTGQQRTLQGPSQHAHMDHHNPCSTQNGPPDGAVMLEHGDENAQPNTQDNTLLHAQHVEQVEQLAQGMSNDGQHSSQHQHPAVDLHTGELAIAADLVSSPYSEHVYGHAHAHAHGHATGYGYGYEAGEHNTQLSASQQSTILHQDPAEMQVNCLEARTASAQESFGKPQIAIAIGTLCRQSADSCSCLRDQAWSDGSLARQCISRWVACILLTHVPAARTV